VPLRVAQGIQNKILEAMAWELPVVTAPRIVRSLGLADDGPVLQAETALEYARGVLGLLGDDEERRSRGIDGRRFVAEFFAWEPRLAALDALLESRPGRVEVEAPA
jgi:glycosyltransferase involved in cell wall biosynthesis